MPCEPHMVELDLPPPTSARPCANGSPVASGAGGVSERHGSDSPGEHGNGSGSPGGGSSRSLGRMRGPMDQEYPSWAAIRSALDSNLRRRDSTASHASGCSVRSSSSRLRSSYGEGDDASDNDPELGSDARWECAMSEKEEEAILCRAAYNAAVGADLSQARSSSPREESFPSSPGSPTLVVAPSPRLRHLERPPHRRTTESSSDTAGSTSPIFVNAGGRSPTQPVQIKAGGLLRSRSSGNLSHGAVHSRSSGSLVRMATTSRAIQSSLGACEADDVSAPDGPPSDHPMYAASLPGKHDYLVLLGQGKRSRRRSSTHTEERHGAASSLVAATEGDQSMRDVGFAPIYSRSPGSGGLHREFEAESIEEQDGEV
mmetsp:Transcript_17066/g.42991  ORF Transcript_17066/g.42991 Transcript_17066/m.42991 type:complete len:372 (-) Transcript_17066:200-1315(-)